MTTAVVSALPFQPDSRSAWSANGHGHTAMDSDEGSRVFAPIPRKTAQRQNSSSSLASNSSSTSTSSAATAVPATSVAINGSAQPSSDAGNWSIRKKPVRAPWFSGKTEPATGITAIRPQAVNPVSSGPTASSAIAALNGPAPPSASVNGNGTSHANSAIRGSAVPDAPAILHLLPINGTFERKTINVPYYPDVLKVGRQTNQKTVPTPLNGFFDSKVLSRQHAEIWADRQGRVFIRDVKSSNGTFVNGMRLSQENKESEPRELREQDVLELGIDIVSEDQKTVVHHKVAAKVEHAGIYSQGGETLSFGELDSNLGNGQPIPPHPLKRAGSQGSLNRAPVNPVILNQQAISMSFAGQPAHMRGWLNPITAEHIVKKLNAEMKMALQQSQDLARARQTIELILGARVDAPLKENRGSSDRVRSSPIKSRTDLKTHFSEPPAPPPQAPLPEKPDVARALADPLILPLLRRSDTARPASLGNSPTRTDHSGDILRLCEELKLAKGELSTQNERMKTLEHELAQERTARETAEVRAQQLEFKETSPTNSDDSPIEESTLTSRVTAFPEMQAQLERLQISMDEMKQQMEAYRRRAEIAETERDEARQSLAEMVEEKRRQNAERKAPRTPPKTPRSPSQRSPHSNQNSPKMNGHAVAPDVDPPNSTALLERAGVEGDEPITPDQATLITQLLSQEVLRARKDVNGGGGQGLSQYARASYGSAAAVLILGMLVMTWANGLPKVDRASLGLS